ncbi:MAG: hypothetical protein ACKVQS_06795 [Fimbriimonadaceae bacterium]
MINLLAAAAIISSESTIEEFFPLRAGMVKVYEEEVNSKGKNYKFTVIETYKGAITLKRREQYIDENEPVIADREKIREVTGEGFEVLTSVDSTAPVPTYYQVNGNRVFIVGIEKDRLLKDIYPIFAYGRDPESFIYQGEIPVMGAPALAFIDGETKSRSDYKFQDKSYPAVSCSLNYKINIGSGITLTSEQKSIYAKGIGLVEFEEIGKTGTLTTKRKRKLTKIQLP